MFLKIATNDRSDKMFLLTSKFRPDGVVSPCPAAIYMYKIMKKLYKIRLQRDCFFKLVANYRSDKRFLLTSTFCPLGLSALTCGFIHLLNHEKMCIKSEIEEILFKLATTNNSGEAFLLTSNFGPYGLCAPALGICLNFFSSITAYFNISSALR